MAGYVFGNDNICDYKDFRGDNYSISKCHLSTPSNKFPIVKIQKQNINRKIFDLLLSRKTCNDTANIIWSFLDDYKYRPRKAIIKEMDYKFNYYFMILNTRGNPFYNKPSGKISFKVGSKEREYRDTFYKRLFRELLGTFEAVKGRDNIKTIFQYFECKRQSLKFEIEKQREREAKKKQEREMMEILEQQKRHHKINRNESNRLRHELLYNDIENIRNRKQKNFIGLRLSH